MNSWPESRCAIQRTSEFAKASNAVKGLKKILTSDLLYSAGSKVTVRPWSCRLSW